MKLKIEIDIPEPKFKQGDFIELREDDDREGMTIVAQVYEVHMSGTWDVINGDLVVRQGDDVCDFDDPDRALGSYLIVLQDGCWNTQREPLRPGKTLSYSIRALDQWAKPHTYTGTVWTIDTHKNIEAREKRWEANELHLMSQGRRTRSIMLD